MNFFVFLLFFSFFSLFLNRRYYQVIDEYSFNTRDKQSLKKLENFQNFGNFFITKQLFMNTLNSANNSTFLVTKSVFQTLIFRKF